MELDERLEAVFSKLQNSILDDRGYGGPVHHKAYVDSWDLLFSQSDFGDVMIHALDDENKISIRFEVAPDNVWYGHRYEYSTYFAKWVEVGRKATHEDKKLVAELAEKAMWKDMIKRNKDKK